MECGNGKEYLPFSRTDVILGILINSHLLDDSLIWAWTPNGKFNVRRAYKVAQKYGEKRNQQGESGGFSDGSRMKAIWKMIWNLNCPNKVKHFM